MSRRLLGLPCLLALVLHGLPAWSQTWPQRPLRIVVGFTPGGGIDIVARMIAPKLTEALGQPVIVENRPGANGILATELVAKATPDGHTVFIGTTGNLSVNPVLFPKLAVRVDRDFVPVVQTSSVPFLLYVNNNFPPRTLQEFIAHAKANPGKVSFYSSGTGGLPHLTCELLNASAGLKTTHVPYKGSAPGFNALLGGEVQYGFDAVPTGLQHVKAGKARALATTSASRLSVLPDVPAVKESLPGFEVVNWYGVVAPAGTPAHAIERLYAEISKAVHSPEIRDKLSAQGIEPADSNPKAFGAFMKAESAKWGRVIRDANIQAQ
ncbi:MAG: tripartite tricarboxylate transporter substrate binding protein [Burkholderiales bacterium]|nr:tripartite tricarboxylate transporter substrate binding protein [Burkholderiales bacterium]